MYNSSNGGEFQFQGSLGGSDNLRVEACLVLTNDPKPRLRWTSELHDRFIDAVTQLGGPDKATPKTIMRAMDVKGLTLYHLKSHLQKYRMGKQSCKEFPDNSKDASNVVECQTTGPSSSSRRTAHDLNDGCNEAMRVQMELQRRLHEQLEVQQHLQTRIEAQSKYLNSMLERACNALTEPNITETGLESAWNELSELPIKMPSDCLSFPCESLKLPYLSDVTAVASLEEKYVNGIPQIAECSVDSCLTSTDSPGRVPVLGSQVASRKRLRHFLFGNDESHAWDEGVQGMSCI